jgi:DNA-binding response OmpR family regulator
MERILIIEDEEKIARFIEMELKYEGYEAEKAYNGRDGLLLATTKQFDLILLDGGADDYITKPFAIEELLARIRAALRKDTPGNTTKASSALIAGSLCLDPVKREVSVDGNLLDLTKREFDLLYYLLENKNIVISRENLLKHIWGYDFSGGTNSVDVYIRYLRAKIEEPFGIKVLHTVRGVGYVIKDE